MTSVVVDLGALDVLAQRLAGDGQRVEMQVIADLRPSAPAGRRHRRNPPSGICRRSGRMLAITGTLRLARSKSSSPTSWPARRASAIRWMMALVEQPTAMATVMALRNASRVRIFFGRQVLPHHVDDAPAGLGGHADVVGVGRRDRRGAGQRHAERLGHRHHGGGRAPWSCRCRSCAQCPPRHRPSRRRRSCRRGARPSISRRRSPSPGPCPSSCRAASAQPAGRSPAGRR